MPRISQRALNQDALIYMEKTAAGNGGGISTISPGAMQAIERLIGGSGRSIAAGNNKYVTLREILENFGALANRSKNAKPQYLNKLHDDIVKTLRNKLDKRLNDRAKKYLQRNGKNLLSETGDVLLHGGGEGQGLVGAAGAGAGVGAVAGAFTDNDEEQSNILGITQKRKGTFMDRVKSIATGAALGGAAGAGLKAKGIAKQKLDRAVGALTKQKKEIIKNMAPEQVLNTSLSKFAPSQLDDDLVNVISKIYQKSLKENPKKHKDLSELLNANLFGGSSSDIRGMDPKFNGVLERALDSLIGGPARRRMKAEDTYDALTSLSRLSSNELSDNLRKLRASTGDSAVEAFKILESSPYNNKYNINFSDDDLNNISSYLQNLYNTDEGAPEFARLFQKRRKGLSLPGVDKVLFRGDDDLMGLNRAINPVIDWLTGSKSPERFRNYLDTLVDNYDAI